MEAKSIVSSDCMIVQRAEGVYVWLEGDTQPYIDLIQGYSTTNWGHRHPDLIAAAARALDDIDHVTDFEDPLQDRVRTRLIKGCDLAEGDTYFDVGGAQTVRLALHAAISATRRTRIACLENCFHGYGCSGARLTDAFLRPDLTQPDCGITEILTIDSRTSVERIRRGDLGAVIVEPIQGAAGFQMVPAEWLRDVAGACKESGTLLISDEIQVGLGRTGTFTALEHTGISADMYLFGKALGAGLFPIGVMVARPGILPAQLSEREGFGSTFTDNQFGIRIADAVLDLIEMTMDKQTIINKGEHLCKGLRNGSGTGSSPRCRHYGLAVAIDFDHSDQARAFRDLAFDDRIICYVSGVRKDIVKLFPPLNLSDDFLYELGLRLGRTFVEVEGARTT